MGYANMGYTGIHGNFSKVPWGTRGTVSHGRTASLAALQTVCCTMVSHMQNSSKKSLHLGNQQNIDQVMGGYGGNMADMGGERGW